MRGENTGNQSLIKQGHGKEHGFSSKDNEKPPQGLRRRVTSSDLCFEQKITVTVEKIVERKKVEEKLMRRLSVFSTCIFGPKVGGLCYP